MAEKLEQLARAVALTSLASLGATPSSAAEEPKDYSNLSDPAGVDIGGEERFHVFRQSRPKLILSLSPNSSPTLISSHRSHRSHSSHRSHYSSSGGQPRPAPPPPPPPESVESFRLLGSRLLQRGSVGPDVGVLMLRLVKLGHLKAQDINTANLFTEPVEVAVKAFQRARSLLATGQVDSATAALLEEPIGALGSRLLAKGMKGPDVGELMLRLVKLGYLRAEFINTENLFTDEVQAAVRAFQKAKGLPESGQVNAATVMLLKAGP